MTASPAAATTPTGMATRIAALDWSVVGGSLDELGCAPTAPVLTVEECGAVAGFYDDDTRFRSTVDMARHRFGEGQYRYFSRPLPGIVEELRAAFWPHLLDVARRWAIQLGRPAPWPDAFDEWLELCHAAGQHRPTPLLLRYGPGDWNALHRDLYGDMVFPLQVVVGLDRPDVDFTGGELVMTEQRPRAQSRATVTRIEQGQCVVLTTKDRPVVSARGWSAAPMRHGVSVLRSGRRHALGLLFHDAT